MRPYQSFTGQRGPLAGFLLGSFGLVVLWSLTGSIRVALPANADHLMFYGILALVTWGCLRAEGARPSSLGLSSDRLVPALASVGALILACNIVGVLTAVALGKAWGIERLWGDQSIADWVGMLILNLAIIALVEEIAFRGYLLNKLLALHQHRHATATAVIFSGFLFAAWHVPGWDLTQPWVNQAPLFALLFGTGVVFGLIYHFTRNLYLVGLLHGFGNLWPFAFDLSDWPIGALVLFWAVTALLYLATPRLCLCLQARS